VAHHNSAANNVSAIPSSGKACGPAGFLRVLFMIRLNKLSSRTVVEGGGKNARSDGLVEMGTRRDCIWNL